MWADLHALADVACEIDIIFATRPGLDRILDHRLVEQFATASARLARLHLAIEREGFTALLTSYDARLAPLVERLERAVHERATERQAAAKRSTDVADLERYRPRPARGGVI